MGFNIPSEATVPCFYGSVIFKPKPCCDSVIQCCRALCSSQGGGPWSSYPMSCGPAVAGPDRGHHCEPIIHTAAKKLQNSHVILMLFLRGAEAWSVGCGFQQWDPLHVVQIPHYRTGTLCLLRHLRAERSALGVLIFRDVVRGHGGDGLDWMILKIFSKPSDSMTLPAK